MYNLFVLGHPDAYDDSPIHLDLTRCIHEWTDEDVTKQFGELDAAAKSLFRVSHAFLHAKPGTTMLLNSVSSPKLPNKTKWCGLNINT